MNLLRHVDLCSGIGGFALGFHWANLSKPIMFCDIEPWSRQILSKHWPDVPIATDVKELANDPDGLVPDCDILTAGYPCQPFSQAGQRRGSEDDRHIWPYIFSIVQRKRPSWCVFENVYGHVSMGLDQVLSDLEGESYAARPFVVPACAVDAPHRRDRLWIICRNVGNTKHDGSSTATIKGSVREASKHNSQRQNKAKQSERASQSRDSGGLGESTRARNVGNTENERYKQWSDVEREGAKDKQEQRLGVRSEPSGSSEDVADTQSLFSNVGREHTEQSKRQVSKLGERGGKINVADTDSKRLQGQWREHEFVSEREAEHSVGSSGEEVRAREYWKSEPSVGRVAHGVRDRIHRLKGLGNAIVPQIAMRIGQTIKQIEEQDGR